MVGLGLQVHVKVHKPHLNPPVQMNFLALALSEEKPGKFIRTVSSKTVLSNSIRPVREVPGKLGSGLVVFVWLVGGIPSCGLTGTSPPLVATAGKEGCSEAGHRGPIPWCSRCWWPLESGNATRPDPTFPGTSHTC